MISEPTHPALRLALYRISRALARIVLRHGVSGREFIHIAKKAMVDVAREEYGKRNRPTNKARIAVMTGFTRADVTRLVDEPAPYLSDAGSAHPLNRLVMHWLRESPWASAPGQARVLPIEGGEDSFVGLAHATGRDAAWQTLLGELERTHLVKISDEQVQLLKPGFLPASSEVAALPFLAEDVPALIDTMDFNLQSQNLPKRFQRKVVFPALSEAGWAHLRSVLESDGQRLLEQLDDELRDHVPESTEPGKGLAGMGIYLIDYTDLEKD